MTSSRLLVEYLKTLRNPEARHWPTPSTSSRTGFAEQIGQHRGADVRSQLTPEQSGA